MISYLVIFARYGVWATCLFDRDCQLISATEVNGNSLHELLCGFEVIGKLDSGNWEEIRVHFTDAEYHSANIYRSKH